MFSRAALRIARMGLYYSPYHRPLEMLFVPAPTFRLTHAPRNVQRRPEPERRSRSLGVLPSTVAATVAYATKARSRLLADTTLALG